MLFSKENLIIYHKWHITMHAYEISQHDIHVSISNMPTTKYVFMENAKLEQEAPSMCKWYFFWFSNKPLNVKCRSWPILEIGLIRVSIVVILFQYLKNTFCKYPDLDLLEKVRFYFIIPIVYNVPWLKSRFLSSKCLECNMTLQSKLRSLKLELE